MLRFAIICRDTTLAAWQMQTIEHLRTADTALVTLLVVDEQDAGSQKRDAVLWQWYSSLYLNRRASSRTSACIETHLGGIPILHTARDSFGGVSDAVIAAVRAHDLDFILDFGTEPIIGDLRAAPRYGVWSFAEDESDSMRRSPPCFWAIYGDTPTIRVTLRQLGSACDPDTVLRSGHFRNFTHSYLRTRETTQRGITRWPAQVCRDIQRGSARPVANAPTTPLSARGAPTNRQVIGFLLRLAWRFTRTAWVGLLFRDRWNIGIVAAPIETFLDADARPPVQWLPKPPPKHFLADPFVSLDGTLFVEEFDDRTQRGHIAALTALPDGSYSAPQRAIVLPVHMSYPSIIHHQGDVYCVPETGEAGEIALYKATAFPHQWTKCMTLVAGFAGLDATIFQYDDRWWLFCTEQGTFSNVMLHAWHAPDLFGPWTPHPGNPLKTDVRSSRPAGMPFMHRGHCYRPAQDCSRTYGGAVAINRIVHLSPTAFEEECVAVIAPDADSPYHYGLHTLSAFDQSTVIDGKGRAFAPVEVYRVLRTLLRDIPRRVYGRLR
ncbi:MAG: hypothetical protein M3Y58_18535 [Chloroflexota bacterium]|nr:hypothetical protein [Chloroflexota bacterium]